MRNHSAMVADTVKQLRTVTLVRACADQRELRNHRPAEGAPETFLAHSPRSRVDCTVQSTVHTADCRRGAAAGDVVITDSLQRSWS